MDLTQKTQAPVIEAPVKECKICDTMISLGLAAATCENLPQGERRKCQEAMKPLEEKKAAPDDILAEIILLTGDQNLNEVLDRMNLVLYSATEKAKQKLIAQGKLNADGMPKE